MQFQLPNGVSIVLGVALVGALTAIAGALPGEVPDWTGLAAAAVIGGVAKALQEKIIVDGITLRLERSSAWRRWLVG